MPGVSKCLTRAASFDADFASERWTKSDVRLTNSCFCSLTAEWQWSTPLRTDYERRQALVEIKSEPAFQHIPIVILTSSEDQADVDFTMKAGAESFFTKPATFDEWVEIMRSLAKNWILR